MFRFIILISFIQISVSSYSQQNVMFNGCKETIYSINSNTSTLEDLIPLISLFQSKEIVGMGEATHGTNEFFKTKFEMFKFLVMKCNFRVFGIEASFGAQLNVNEYVKNGTGNINQVLEFLDWPWGTEEVRELVEWVKNYNLNKNDTDKISFYGFDMQNISYGIKFYHQFLAKDSSDFSKDFKKITPLLYSNSEYDVFKLIANENRIIKDSLYAINDNLKKWVKIYENKISKTYGKKEYDRFYLCIENFSQSLSFIYGGNHSFIFRDSCMAFNVSKIHEIENSKMFIWAHNGHIGLEYQKIPIMGTYLKKSMKEKYYAIGFVFDHGSFMAYKGPNTIADAIVKFIFNQKKLYQGLMECNISTNKKNTLTNELNKLGMQSFFIDLNSTTNTLFTNQQRYYDIGATFMNSRHASSKIIAKNEFDGLIYFNSTSATKLISE